MKLNVDGLTQQLRARLVVKGRVRKAGIDYYDTFSPVARYDTVRAVLTVATLERMQLRQLDIKTNFLYGTLQEEVYMRQPGGFEDGCGRVCKIKRSLYDLKQALGVESAGCKSREETETEIKYSGPMFICTPT